MHDVVIRNKVPYDQFGLDETLDILQGTYTQVCSGVCKIILVHHKPKCQCPMFTLLIQ